MNMMPAGFPLESGVPAYHENSSLEEGYRRCTILRVCKGGVSCIVRGEWPEGASAEWEARCSQLHINLDEDLGFAWAFMVWLRGSGFGVVRDSPTQWMLALTHPTDLDRAALAKYAASGVPGAHCGSPKCDWTGSLKDCELDSMDIEICPECRCHGSIYRGAGA